MSMQSGAPTFGTPEPALVLYAMAALARRLGVPFRSGGTLRLEDPRRPGRLRVRRDAPADGPRRRQLRAPRRGWLEGGLAIGYEKFVLDADQCGMMAVFVKGIDLSENGQALDAIRDNGPGPALPGQRPHAGQLRDRLLPLRSPTTTPSSNGGGRSLDAAQRANAIWKRMLAEYEAPPIDPRWTRRCSTSSPSARRRFPTRRSEACRSGAGAAGATARAPRPSRASSPTPTFELCR